MNNLFLEAEYADIIVGLLDNPFCLTSVTKIVFTAFCVKNEHNIKTYSKRKLDLIDTFFRNLSIKLLSHPDELVSILSVLEKLEGNGFLLIEPDGDTIKVSKKLEYSLQNNFLKSMKTKSANPIFEINKLTTKTFLEEVLRYV